MTETENGDITPLKPKKREGSRLDRGFPMGITLLVILGFVFFFQIISAWKIINLEREKAKYETDKQNSENNVKQRPGLEREISEFQNEHNELRSKINDLEKAHTKAKDMLNRNIQKSDELKVDNEMQEKRLVSIKGLVQEAETARVQAFNEQKVLNKESLKIKSDIKISQAEISSISGSLSSDSSGLSKVLSAVNLKVGNSVQKLGEATSNIETNSKDFNEKVSTLDISSKKLYSLLDNIKFIYRELDSIKQRQTAMVDNFQELVSKIGTTSANLDKDLLEFRKTFEQIEKDLSNTIEGIKVLKEVEKKTESLNTGTKKSNEKEEE